MLQISHDSDHVPLSIADIAVRQLQSLLNVIEVIDDLQRAVLDLKRKQL